MGGLLESLRVCSRFLIKFSGYFNHKCACHDSEGSVSIDNNQIIPAITTENAKKAQDADSDLLERQFVKFFRKPLPRDIWQSEILSVQDW